MPKKQLAKKAIAAFVIIAMALSVTIGVSAKSFEKRTSDSIVAGRIKLLVKEKINAAGSDIAVGKIKILHDFSGNRYELVECEPTGYFIIHLKSGVTVEYSTTAQSPYKNQNLNLYYGGPTYYYQKSGSAYIHTVLGTVVTGTSDPADTCKAEEKELESHINPNVKNYIDGKVSCLSGDGAVSDSSKTNYTVKDPNWFKNLNSGFGYVDGGYCGYIAANLILKYWHYHSTISIGSYYYINDTSLTKKLISIGGSGGTWAQPICNTLNKFCSQKKIPQCASWHAGVLGLVNEIQNEHRPAILFGKLKSAGNHAVVAYGVNTYENKGFYTFICHYGWNNGWSNVHICGLNSVFGSNAQYNLPKSYQY